MSRALGRYELLRPLARGGMAEVFLARRKAAGVEKMLVVKRIRPERSGDVRFLDLFVREARLSMSLAHQNIVPVFDFGRIDDQVFLAMERVEGRDLGSSLARAGAKRLPPMVAAFVAAECCQALDYAHRRKSPEGEPLGIVHRDVTPRNVLASWSGEVKLTDFGIAALAGDATSSVTGTPAYMAPEQARNEAIDPRADVYAVGLVLRELLTGERARPGTEREATLAAAKAGTLLPWPDGVIAELRAIADKATQALAGDRYADARAMAAELDAFIVAERAANKGEPPARQLAAWLDEVWGAERDERGAGASDDIAGDHLVSFLDHGALDVVGTGTQRSMAATAADAAPEPPPPPGPTMASPRRWPLVLGLAAVLAAGAVIALRMLGAAGNRAAAPDAALAIPPPPPIDAAIDAPIDAAIDADIDAAVAVAPGPPDAGPRVVRTTPRQSVDAGIDATAAAVPSPIAAFHVTVNAVPWAHFTVDDDPRTYETMKAVPLAPGPHTIHFAWPTGETRDKAFDMPADRNTSVVEPLGR